MARGETYEEFVEKYKPKLTTDDCYTPEAIYDVVKDWAVKEYSLQGRAVMRPFYPGGDYENETYPEGCVVIDNPPFSILTKICRFYQQRNIMFFLFAPSLTSINTTRHEGISLVQTYSDITYENGATIKTAFLTNIATEAYKVRTAPDLQRALEVANKGLYLKKQMPKYAYPDEVLTGASLFRISAVPFGVRAEDMYFIRELDAQKEKGKGLFCGGYLLSEKATAEKTIAEKAAAEKADVTQWLLSDRERALQKQIGQ